MKRIDLHNLTCLRDLTGENVLKKLSKRLDIEFHYRDHKKTVSEMVNVMVPLVLQAPNGLNRVFFISSLSGIFPFSWDLGGVVTNYKVLAATSLLRLFFFGEVVFCLLPETNEGLRGNGQSFWRHVFMLQYLANFAFLVYNYWNRTQLVLLAKYFSKADGHFFNFGVGPHYKTVMTQDLLIFAIGFITFFLVPLTTVPGTLNLHFCYMSLSIMYVIWQSFAVIQPFVQAVRIIGNRFMDLQDIFSNLCRSKYDNEINEKVESVVNLCELLCTTCELLMELFSLQSLFVYFNILMNVVVAIFRILLSGPMDSPLLILNQFLILLYHAALCVYLTTHCKKTSDKSGEFNSLLSQMMVKESLADISNNRKLRLHVGMKRQVVFKACGCFNLDYTLVHSVIAAATTYLVILIQLG